MRTEKVRIRIKANNYYEKEKNEMKKIIVLILALAMLCSLFVSCADTAPGAESSEPAPASVSPSEESSQVSEEKIMTYAEYAAAAVDSEVVVETYVQAKQSWWEKEGVGGVGTFYTQDENGGYFLYDMPCSKEDYDKLVKGTKIKVTGKKTEWSGQVEIIDATFVIEDGKYEAPVTDITALVGKEELAAKMTQYIAIKGATVEASKDAEGNDAAWLYKWNGAGSEGDDLYFKVNVNGVSLTLVVESYLCGKDTDVYKAVKELKVGDKIDIEGFLYWYEGAQPHVVNVTVNN